MYTHHCYQCPNCLRYVHVPKSEPKVVLEYCTDCDYFFTYNETFESYYDQEWHINFVDWSKLEYKEYESKLPYPPIDAVPK